MRMGSRRRFDDCFGRRVGRAVANVLENRFVEQKRLLRDEPNLLTQIFPLHIAKIDAIELDATLAGIVKSTGLGPLHTEFDDKGNAYTTFFISSEVIKWKVGTWEVLDRVPCYYSVGHLMIPGGDSREPAGKYMLALNKITKDRYLPTGPEVNQSAQLFDISGEKMELILDFPTVGEPHYAQGIADSR